MDFDGFDDYRQNTELESKVGIDLDFGKGRVITILRAGGSNFRYARAFQKATTPYRYRGRMKDITPEEDRRILREVYADSIIIGWKGIVSNGNTVPFLRENVIDFLERFDTIFEEIIEKANDYRLFLDELKEEDAKALGNS